MKEMDVTTCRYSMDDLKEIFEGLMGANPDFKDDPEAVREKIREFDSMVDGHIKDSKTSFSPELVPAISILLQGRNIMARLIGDKEREMPDMDSDLHQLDPAVMKTLDREITVAVVDDRREEVLALLGVLDEWPKVKPVFVSASDGNLDSLVHRIINTSASVVLLDESMSGSVTGTAVQSRLKQGTIRFTIASVTGGGKPDWAQHHFSGKLGVKKQSGRENFIRFFNQLI